MKRSEFGNSKRGRFKTFVGLLLVIVAVWRLFCIGMDYREGEETYRKLEQAVSIHSEIRKESVQAEDTADTQETQDRGQAEKAAFDFSSIEIDFSSSVFAIFCKIFKRWNSDCKQLNNN